MQSSGDAKRRTIPGWPVTDRDYGNFEAYLLDETGPGGGRVARLAAIPGADGGPGALFQMFWSAEYRGKRVRLSANLRTHEADMGGLCLRVPAHTDSGGHSHPMGVAMSSRPDGGGRAAGGGRRAAGEGRGGGGPAYHRGAVVYHDE